MLDFGVAMKSWKRFLNRGPVIVNHTESRVTILHVIRQNTHGHEVVDLLERQAAFTIFM